MAPNGIDNTKTKTATTAGTTLKGLQDELDLINRQGKPKPKHTIKSASTYADIGSSTSREDLFKLIKELYGFAERALDLCNTMGGGTSASSTDLSQLGVMIKSELSGILPEMLQDALKSLKEPCCGGPANHDCSNSREREEKTLPIQQHTLELEKKCDADELLQNEDAGKISTEEWTTVVKKDVKGALKNVPVLKTSSSLKSTKLHFENQDDLQRAERALEGKYRVTSKSEDRKMLNPKLTISDLDDEIKTKEMLLDEIKSKNTHVNALVEEGEELKVVFLSKKDPIAVIEVSVKIRNAIKQSGDKLCIGLERYLVKDRFHVIQCFHCQEYGHMADSPFCKSKDDAATCFYCAGKHSSKECTNKKERKVDKIKCVNCSKSRNPRERSACTSHKASDPLCPVFIREKERVMSRTAGSTEAKNNYLTRVRDLKQKLGRI